jgi:hypothetical protein
MGKNNHALFHAVKDGLVSPPVSGQTNLGCGEWDFSNNTYITWAAQKGGVVSSG